MKTNTNRVEAAEKKINKKIPPTVSSASTSNRWIKTMFGGEYNDGALTMDEYDEMLSDPQIKTGIQFLSYALRGKKYHITPASEEDEDIEIAEWIRKEFDSLLIPLRHVRKDIYTALQYGYSVGEIVYEQKDDGRIGLNRIQSININTLENCFEYDENTGLLDTIWQTPSEQSPIPIPAEKCLIYSFDEEFGNKYGNSLLKQVYKNYYMKKEILKWYTVFLQKHEGPTLVGKAGPETDAQDLQDNLDSVREGRTGFVMDIDDEVNILESSHRGESFMTAVTYHDTVIFRRFFIGSLLFGQAEASGSYAQSQTHLDTLSTVLDGIHEDVAGTFQELIKKLVDYNYNTDTYPKFAFEPFTKKDLIQLLNVLTPLADKFIIDSSSSWFKQLLKVIVSEYGDVEIKDEDIEMTEDNIGEKGNVPPPDWNKFGNIPDDTDIVGKVQEILPSTPELKEE